MTAEIHGPWMQHGTAVYFAGNKGGFDLSGCPFPQHKARLAAAAPDLLAAAQAALAYDNAIAACGNDPDSMSSHCTAEGDNLDALYDDWMSKSRAAIAKATGSAS